MKCKRYKKSFNLDMTQKKKEVIEKFFISIAAIIKIGKDGAVVSSKAILKICSVLSPAHRCY